MLSLLSHSGLFITLGIFMVGALLSVAFSGKSTGKDSWVIAHVCGALGGFTGLGFALLTILDGTNTVLHVSSGIGIAPDILSLHIDGLAAFFVATISTVAIAASIFGITYYDHYLGVYRLGSFGFFYNIFLASMLLVVSSNNGFLFLLAWEMMAVASYFLVIFERKEEKNISAGTLYLLISQLGAAFLFGAFLILYKYTNSWDFDVIRTFSGGIPFAVQNTVLALALVGLASKAGVIPLHIWLPEAHPAAPSHVSALMSGVMIKTAIFMIIRFFIDLFPTPHPAWGLLILTLGAISSLFGILYALSERDIKRLLAYSSVENIGIILMGLGAAITFFSFGATPLGVIALVAALYHTVNHALFKSLLFLGAGSVVHATGTRNMETYGGLMRVMPWTAGFFLIGAVSISGLPPFNGFVSEWFTFQSLIAGIAGMPVIGKIIFILAASSLAFTGGLAAATFVKAFGTTFLARPRHAHAHVHESDLTMRLGMGILAALTVTSGLAAGTIAPALADIVATLRRISGGPITLAQPTQVINLGHFSSLSMPGVFLALALGAIVIVAFASVMSRDRKVVISRTWDCGVPLTPRMEITATGFSRSLIVIFHGLLRPTTQTDVEYHDDTIRYFTKTKSVHLSLPNLYYRYIYQPVIDLIAHGAHRARRIQTGNLNTYLLYMFLTLLILLYWTLK